MSNISQIGHVLQVGLKIQNVWNNHVAMVRGTSSPKYTGEKRKETNIRTWDHELKYTCALQVSPEHESKAINHWQQSHTFWDSMWQNKKVLRHRKLHICTSPSAWLKRIAPRWRPEFDDLPRLQLAGLYPPFQEEMHLHWWWILQLYQISDRYWQLHGC